MRPILDSDPQNCETINFCVAFSHLGSCNLLQQPEETRTFCKDQEFPAASINNSLLLPNWGECMKGGWAKKILIPICPHFIPPIF